MLYLPKIGDVILNNGMQFVVIDYKSYEDMGSLSFDRKYKICLYEELVDKEIIDLDSNLGYWIEVRGVSFPDIEKVEDIAPFVITKVNYAKVKQKQGKTITVYE